MLFFSCCMPARNFAIRVWWCFTEPEPLFCWKARVMASGTVSLCCWAKHREQRESFT